MRTTIISALLAFSALTGGAAAQEANAKLKVACTLPVLKAIADEIDPDGFETFALAKGDQDPHFVSPTPLLMNKVRGADLFLAVGLSLELWAADVTNGSGNAKIFPAGKAHIIVTRDIPAEDVPTELTRAQGDIHPQGNPHMWLDPLRVKRVAENMAAAMKEIHPKRAAQVDAGLAKFAARMDEAIFGAELVKLAGSKKLARLCQDGELWKWLETNEAGGIKLSTKVGGWLKRGESLRGARVVEFHRTWIYLAKLLGIEIVGAVEEKPGIEPPPKHIVRLIETIKEKKARLIIVDNFYDTGKPRRIAEESGAKLVILPNQPTGEADTTTYFAFMDHVIDKMVEGLK